MKTHYLVAIIASVGSLILGYSLPRPLAEFPDPVLTCRVYTDSSLRPIRIDSKVNTGPKSAEALLEFDYDNFPNVGVVRLQKSFFRDGHVDSFESTYYGLESLPRVSLEGIGETVYEVSGF